METLRLLATLVPLSVSSGINLYATILVAGLSIRFGWVQNPPPALDVLASWPVLITAAILFVVELFADKVPFVDNLWDLIHTPIRPLGAALIAFGALAHVDPALMVVGSLLAGGLALVSHSGKAGSRVALNVASPTENITNIAMSVVEDLVAGSLTFIALKYPYQASAIALVLLGLIILIVPQLVSWAWFTVQSVLVTIKALIQRALNRTDPPDQLPAAHGILLEHQVPELTSYCRAQNLKGANGKSGYLSIVNGQLAFTFGTLFGHRLWQIPLRRVIAAYLTHRLMIDVLQVHYYDDKQKERVVRFAFLKDRSRVAEQMQARLGRPVIPGSAAPAERGLTSAGAAH